MDDGVLRCAKDGKTKTYPIDECHNLDVEITRAPGISKLCESHPQ